MSLTYDQELLRRKGDQYCKNNNTSIVKQLGFGTQGMVFKTADNTAIKVHNIERGYIRERDAYKRLKAREIQTIRGMMIPRILNWDDELFIMEMSIVHEPCILDFGGTYLDEPPQHLVRDEIWRSDKAEEFGENWPEAQEVIKEIEFLGDIWLADVNTGNIKFQRI